VAVPSKPTLTSPSGTTTSTTPTYQWSICAGATWYWLYVDGPVTNILSKWYSAATVEIGGVCTVTPDVWHVAGDYKWYVIAWNTEGYSPWSDVCTFTRTAVLPAATTLISPSGTISSIRPLFSWDIVPDATYYWLYVNDATKNVISHWYSSIEAIQGAACTVQSIAYLPPGNYTWAVQTYNKDGFGPWSAAGSFTRVAGVPLAAPLISPLGSIIVTKPTYEWDVVSNATYYYLWINGPSGNVYHHWYTSAEVFQLIDGIRGKSSICSATPDVTLTEGNYIWWVQTWNEDGFGPWSDAGHFEVTTTYGIKEVEVQRKPVELYHLWIGSLHYYYTNVDMDIIYDSNTYHPAVIKRGSITKDGQTGASSLSITFGYLDQPIVELIANEALSLVWLSVMRTFSDLSPIEASVIFVGNLKSIAFQGLQGAATFVGFEYYLTRPLPRYRYQPQCNWKLFDSDCKLSSGSYAELVTVTQISTDGLQLTLSGVGTHADNYFSQGELVYIAGSDADRRLITSSTGSTIYLRFRVNSMPVNAAVYVYPGCDGALLTCKNKFSNVVNFGGFPRIPVDNPVRWIW
jgi:uncharacterized phage protein (TIGR02218 family)